MKENQPIAILAMNNFFDSAINRLPNQFKIFYPDELEKNYSLIDGIIVTPWTKVSSELINHLPNLKIISCFGVGIDSVDKNAALNKKIIITNTPDVVTEDTADIAITLLLCLARNVIFNDQYARSGEWKISPPPLGISLHNKTLGIVGLGKIGTRVAQKALAFGLKIIYHSRKKKNAPYPFYNNLNKMAKNTDFLVVCCPGGDETRNIIDIETLKSLGKNGYLINISRGSTVNENDLIFALENKIIAGAGLDVYANEPHIPEKLMQMKQVTLLPHIGTATKETREIMLKLVLDNIQSFFESGKALTPVDISLTHEC